MNDLDSVVAALRPRHDDPPTDATRPLGSTGSVGTAGVDQERAAAMLAAITAEPRHDTTGSPADRGLGLGRGPAP